MNKIKYYPNTKSEDFDVDIYRKREFHPNRYNKQGKLDKATIKRKRDETCGEQFSGIRPLLHHQIFLSNFINPETPYKGLLLFHGTGTGKTCAAISIAENFKEQAIKYNTKIYVILSGPTLRENFQRRLLGLFTGNTH